jgi:hypothetical protein
MNPVFRDRVAWKLVLWGSVFLLVACAFLTKDHFVMDVGGRHRIVTRADDPWIYWGAEATILLVGIALVGYGIYRNRKNG